MDRRPRVVREDEPRQLLLHESGLRDRRVALRPPAGLVEVVALRLDDLTGEERAVLELLTLGEPLGLTTLAQLAEPAAIESLERKGLITGHTDGRRVHVWLAHPHYGNVVRTGLSAGRQRILVRSLAQVVESTGGRRKEDTLHLASWRLIGVYEKLGVSGRHELSDALRRLPGR